MSLAIGVSGCGGCGDSDNTPDARVVDSRSCSDLTAGPLQFFRYDASNGYILFRGTVAGDVGDGLGLIYQLGFYAGVEPSLSGSFDLAMGNQANFKSCAVCVQAFGVNAMNQLEKNYFQTAGTVSLTQDPYSTKHVIGSITGLQLEEVDIADDYTSTPVAGGACANVANFNVDRDDVPTAWTCPHDQYEDGATCHCLCGAIDPDCLSDAAPVVNCTTVGDACFAGACVTPPTNDTCAMATPLVLDTPATGTTAGAKHNYNAGLEGATCTGDAQPGPDVVYSIDLTATTAYTITLSGLASTVDLSVAVIGPGAATQCDANPITTCVGGADTPTNGATETVMFTAAATDTYYIVVDSWSAAVGGAFTLAITSP
jgi:hypothetical protein